MVDIARKSCVAVLLVTATLLAVGCDRRHPDDHVLPTVAGEIGKIADRTNDVALGSDVSVEDAEITTKVEEAIFAEPGLQAQHIDVDTQDSVVTLAGTVDSPLWRERALQIAGSVEGVVEVQDKLEVIDR